MKSKAEVAEALKRLVRTLKPFPVGFEGSHLGNAVAEVADALCDEPEPKKIVGVPVEEVAYLGEVGPVVPAKDPTTGDKPEYFLWVGRGDGSVVFDRPLKGDYLMAGANPLRFAPDASWRGRRLRVTFADITDGDPEVKQTWSSWPEQKRALKQAMALAWQEGYNHRDKREPGGTANNPYHVNFQGFANPVAADTPSLAATSIHSWSEALRAEIDTQREAVRNDIPKWNVWMDVSKILYARLRELASLAAAPESWQEERAALVEECERRREQTKKLRGELDTVTAALKGEQGRAEALAEASRRSRGDLEMANDLRCDLAMALELCAHTGRADLLARAKRGTEALKAAAAGATTWQWQEWGRTIVGGIGDSGLELFEAVKQEVAILLETSRANERNAREARGMLQMVSSSPEAIGRMASAIGRATECVSRKIVLSFPEDCAGKEVQIKVTKLA